MKYINIRKTVQICLTISLFILHTSIYAQFQYKRRLDKGEYNKIEVSLQKKYKRKTNDVSINYDFSILYTQNKFDKYCIDTAYFFAKSALKYYKESESKKKLDKKLLSLDTLINNINNICEYAYNDCSNENTIEKYDYFINKFTDNNDLTKKAIKKRNKLAFTNASNTNTIESFQSFINKYPNSNEITEAIIRRNKLAFAEAKSINTIEAYDYFINKYPFSNEINDAIDVRDNIGYETICEPNTSKAYQKFINKYPKSKLIEKANYNRDKCIYTETITFQNLNNNIKFFKNNPHNKFGDAIIDTIYKFSMQENNINGFHFLINNQNNHYLSDSIWYYYYNAFTWDGTTKSILKFKELYENRFPHMNLLNTEYEAARNLESFLNLVADEDYSLIDGFITLNKKYLSFKVASFIFLERAIEEKDWNEAIESLNLLQSSAFQNKNKWLNELEENISRPHDSNIIPQMMSSNINSSEGFEYTPVISTDNKTLFFCAKERKDNFSLEDIFYSEYKNKIWQKSKPIESLNTYGNDAPLSISSDGNTILIFMNGDIYYSEKTIDGWGMKQKMEKPIYSGEWTADAMITSDGKALLFASSRKDINEGTVMGLIPPVEDRNIDIYVSLKTDNGWSTPISLGPTINTNFNERSPFLHPDMKTLYFSSTGHGGFGDYDVFYSTRLNDTSWTEWSKPINLGKEINSNDSEWGYKISTDGTIGYFSRENKIFTINIPNYLRPNFVATISGKLIDNYNNPIESTIIWEDLETQKIIGETKSNPKDGSFFIILPLGKSYGYYVNKDDYFPISNNIDLKNKNEAIIIENDIKMVSFEQMKKEQIAVPINNLFFDVNKYIIKQESFPELKRVAKIIKTNKLKVEISGHTDNTGTPEYNLELSVNRANAVKDFLLKLGIDESLIVTQGYGHTKPIADNQTKKGQALNRRVEIKFL